MFLSCYSRSETSLCSLHQGSYCLRCVFRLYLLLVPPVLICWRRCEGSGRFRLPHRPGSPENGHFCPLFATSFLKQGLIKHKEVKKKRKNNNNIIIIIINNNDNSFYFLHVYTGRKETGNLRRRRWHLPVGVVKRYPS